MFLVLVCFILIVSLFSIGDADLYISDRNPSPSYDINSYLLHSATCGDDIIHVHKSLKRPIYVSVFGHPSYAISQFYVNIVARESSEEDLINLQLLDLQDIKNTTSASVDTGDVLSVPCSADTESGESRTDISISIHTTEATESSNDFSSLLDKYETDDLNQDHENISNLIDQNITNNPESISSENLPSKESPRFFTSFLPAPTGFDVLEGIAEVFLEIIISLFL